MNSIRILMISRSGESRERARGVWGSNWKRRSADGLDSSNDSNDTLESKHAHRNPRSSPGFRFAEVLLIGCTLDSGVWILESGVRGAQQMAAANLTLLRGDTGDPAWSPG